MKYELSQQQLQNLRVFLNRTDVKGSEVPAFVEILNAFASPVEEVSKNPKEESSGE